MSNILNNFSSNADERTELIEYKRIYYVVKYLSPLFFIFLFSVTRRPADYHCGPGGGGVG